MLRTHPRVTTPRAVWLLMGILLGTGSGVLHAEYPERPITVIVHTKPGGGTDTMTRLVWKHAEKLTGAIFAIETHAGAGGQIGYTSLASAEPDGYTLGTITTMSIVTHQLTRGNVGYSFEQDFLPLGRAVFDPAVIAVMADSSFRSFADLIKVGANRQNKWSWGGTFLWGTHHVHYAMFNRATGSEFVYIPFDAAAETRAALLGGHINAASGGMSEYAALVKEGRVRLLAVASRRRLAQFPDVPTYEDLGYKVAIGSDRGFAVPAGTPPERVEFLSTALRSVLEDPAFLAASEIASIRPSLAYMPGPQFARHLENLERELGPLLSGAAVLSDSVATSSAFFPGVVGAALVSLALGGLALTTLNRVRMPARNRQKTATGSIGASLGTFLFFTLILGFYLILPVAGFITSGAAFLAATIILLDGSKGLRYLPVALAVPLLLAIVFGYLLDLRLPPLDLTWF